MMVESLMGILLITFPLVLIAGITGAILFGNNKN